MFKLTVDCSCYFGIIGMKMKFTIKREIEFDFDETKAAQVAGIFVRRCGGLFDYYLLQKCIYALDRTALLKWGQPVIGGNYKMLRWGPINQSAMDASKAIGPGFFSECIERCGNEIILKMDPGTSELSNAEINLVESICDDWRGLTFDAAHDKILAFPECPVFDGVVWIDIEQILTAAKKSVEEIELIRQEARAVRILHHPSA